jgi:hypothetical protein
VRARCLGCGKLAGESACPTEQHSRNQRWADEGVGRGPGGPPHKSSQAVKIFRSSSALLEIFKQPGVRRERGSGIGQVTPVGRRHAPKLVQVLRQRENGGVALQVDVQEG